MKNLICWPCLASLFIAQNLLPPLGAVTLDDPANYSVRNVWSGASLGLPSPLGGMLFSPDGNTLYVVGASERTDGALYAVPVQRDPTTKAVVGLGPAADVTMVFPCEPATRGLDAGWEWGPDGTLFYTYWPAHRLLASPDMTPGSWGELLAVPNAPFSSESVIPSGPARQFLRLQCTKP